MKQEMVLDSLKKLKTKPNLMRKLKIFALVGVAGFLLTGALAVWAGITAFGYVATKATEVAHSPVAQTHVENLKSELKNLPKLQALSCWSQAEGLIAVQPWLERSAMDNLVRLKAACFEHKPATGKPAEGSTI